MTTVDHTLLTPDEIKAVESLIAAVKALPKSICIDVDDMADDGDPHFVVRKRQGSCMARQVASITKKSLVF